MNTFEGREGGVIFTYSNFATVLMVSFPFQIIIQLSMRRYYIRKGHMVPCDVTIQKRERSMIEIGHSHRMGKEYYTA